MAHSVIFMPECHSTSDEALRLCHKVNGTAEGTVVITDNQTAGRGQRGNSWISNPGKNLTFSIVLKPSFLDVSNQFMLNIVTSLALHDYLSRMLPAKVQIKWPNDMLVAGDKIAGILIDNLLTGQFMSCTVCGIGLNVNQQEWPMKATSMRNVLGRSIQTEDVFESVIECLEARYLMLRSARDHSQLRRDYLKVLYRNGERHTYKAGNTEFYGTILGVDPLGRLLLDTEKGVRTFSMKEIAF